MLDEIRKSINSTLYERTKSPLYGALITSWCLWNWKLIYYLFVVDSKTSFNDRVACIQNELTNNWTLFYGPLLSTLFILTVFEFISNYAYWLHIYYKTWRINKKTHEEGKQLLTYEQSLKLRNDIRQTEEQYEKLIQEKEVEIKVLNDSLSLKPPINNEHTIKEKQTSSSDKTNKVNILYNRLSREEKIDTYKKYCSEILNEKLLNEEDPIIQQFVTLGLFRKSKEYGSGHYYYDLTDLGQSLHDKILYDQQ
jgi:hypothetical protein